MNSMIAVSSSWDRYLSRAGSGSAQRRLRSVRPAAALAGTILALSAVCTQAQEPEPPTPEQGEFMDFLEYLGSWNGPDDEWVSLLGEVNDPDWAQLAIESDEVLQAAPTAGS